MKVGFNNFEFLNEINFRKNVNLVLLF